MSILKDIGIPAFKAGRMPAIDLSTRSNRLRLLDR